MTPLTASPAMATATKLPVVGSPSPAGPGRRLRAQLGRFVLGQSGPRHMPARVRAAIRRSDADTEILVGWVQVAAILTFATLYSLSPKAFPSEVPFAPVPW